MMNRLLRLRRVLYFGCLFCCFCSATRPPAPAAAWKLVWSDEFNYSGLPDSSKWSYDVGGDGWGNHELEYYTANRLVNARVEQGCLVIAARREKWSSQNYTSARLVTKGKGDWTYGRIEVRAKLPLGRGTWPAIWMLGSTTPLKWPDDGEIDIMEHVGFDPGVVHATVHCRKFNNVPEVTAAIRVEDLAQAFHVYSLQWDSDSLHMYIDHQQYFSFGNDHTGYAAWPFQQPMHLLLNVAVGGDWGGKQGVDESVFPQEMKIDYVRVYQR
jgi:beta-glucanase (GH16 family)